MDLNIFLIENFKNIQELIRFTDQKAGFMVVIYGFVLTIFLEFSKGLSLCNPLKFMNITDSIFSVICFSSATLIVILIIFQFYKLIFGVLKPRKASYYSTKIKSLFYFGHIAEMDKEFFLKSFESLSEKDMLNEIENQVYEISKIMKQKKQNFNVCLKSFVPTIVLLIIFFLSSRCY